MEVAATQLGTYILRVTGASVPRGPQPFAIAAIVAGGSVTPPPPPVYTNFVYLPLLGR